MMKRRISLFFFFLYIAVIIILLMACLSCVDVTSRPLSPLPHHQQAKSPDTLLSNSTNNGTDESEEEEEEYRAETEGRVGSRPPNCGHKCGYCKPCQAVQIPTTHSISLQFANYEPEGWKCKCGLSLYNP